jgi:hypothetical protein
MQEYKGFKIEINIYYGRPNHWNRYSFESLTNAEMNGKGHSAECCKEAIDKLTNQ